jgi:hypothetical protein
MDDFESGTLIGKQMEDALKGKHPKIFEKFNLLRIREAITQVINESSSLCPEKSDGHQEVMKDSWVFEMSDDFSRKITEILESDNRLTEKIKSVFYLALANGHMDRVRQLKDTFTDINFSKEVEDAFNDARVHEKRYLLKEIAKFHSKLSYDELWAGSSGETKPD